MSTIYIVEEEVTPESGNWRRSPTMLDRLGRVAYSSSNDAYNAIADLCELIGDDPESYRVVENDA